MIVNHFPYKYYFTIFGTSSTTKQQQNDNKMSEKWEYFKQSYFTVVVFFSITFEISFILKEYQKFNQFHLKWWIGLTKSTLFIVLYLPKQHQQQPKWSNTALSSSIKQKIQFQIKIISITSYYIEKWTSNSNKNH